MNRLLLAATALAGLATAEPVVDAAPMDVAMPVGTSPRAAAPAPLARPDGLDLGRPDPARALASLAGGADCRPPAPPPCGCEPEWKGRVWGSFSVTSGNSDTLAAVIGAEAVWARDPWGMKASVDFLYGKNDGETSAERWHALLRGDRRLNDRTYAFGQLAFDRDEPAGLEYRLIPTAGVGRVLYRTDEQELKGEVGAGLTFEKRVALDETSDPSGYLGLHYVRTWQDKRAFRADLDLFPNLNDVDLTVAKLAFLYEMPLSDTFRVTAGLRFDYVFTPPAGREELDTLFTIGFSANF